MAGHTLRPAACCRMSAALKGRCSRPVLLLTGTPQPCVHSVAWLKTKQDVTYCAKKIGRASCRERVSSPV